MRKSFRWNNVIDIEPQPNQRVLTENDEGLIICACLKKNGKWLNDFNQYDDTIHYWMPFPDSPKQQLNRIKESLIEWDIPKESQN